MTPIELKLWRMARRLSQQDLATRLNVHRVTIARWETEHTPIPEGLPFWLATLAIGERPTPETAPHLFSRQKLRARRYVYQGIHGEGAFIRSK